MFTPDEIRQIEFEKVMRGYRVEDVSAFLDKVATLLQEAQDEKKVLEDQLFALAENIEQYKTDEESIKQAFVSAQKFAQTIVAEANTKAEAILKEAQIKKNDILSQAHEEHNYYEDNLHRMKKEVSDFRENILTLYKEHIESLSALPKEEDILAKEEVEEAIQENNTMQTLLFSQDDEDENLEQNI